MRTHTRAMLTTIEHHGATGYGEAAMVPYYGETHETAADFLGRAAEVLKRHHAPGSDHAIEMIMREIDAISPGNTAAKASVDLALHDLWGKLEDKPLWQLLNLDPTEEPCTSFTLGIDTPDVLRQKLAEAEGFRILKVKLGAGNDRAIIQTIRRESDLPIYVDANQGWQDVHEALDLVHWLSGQNVILIEQPFPKDNLDDAAWLSARSPLPVFADESFHRLDQIQTMASCFHGVNIKLMKCTGISEARHIRAEAYRLGLLQMVGCMTETSCGIYGAALVAALTQFADIDGCWLIKNNPFEMPGLLDGKVVLNERPGLGLRVAPA